MKCTNILTCSELIYTSFRLSALLSFHFLPLVLTVFLSVCCVILCPLSCCVCDCLSLFLPLFFLFLFPSLFHLPHFGVCACTCLCVCVNVCASHILAFHWTMAEIWNPPLKALTPYWLRVLVTLSKGPVVDYSVNMLQQNLLTVNSHI